MTQNETKKERVWEDLTVEQIKWDEPKVVEGRLLEIQDTNQGTPFYVLQDDDGKRIGVLGTTQLAGIIKSRNQGDILRIEYLGEEDTADGQNTFKNFTVKKQKKS
jgi:hypothetical protein